MVKKVDDKGGIYHEPPYTPQEQLEIVRRANGGVVAFSRLTPRPAGGVDDLDIVYQARI